MTKGKVSADIKRLIKKLYIRKIYTSKTGNVNKEEKNLETIERN